MAASTQIFSTLLTVMGTSFLASHAVADLIQIDGSGFAEDYFATIDIADSFPFLGVSVNDPISFHYEIDSSTMMTSITNGIARYDFTGGNSFYMTGDNTLTLDSFSLFVGTTQSGFGIFSMTGRNEQHGVSAGMQIESSMSLSTEIPMDLDLSDFNSFRMLSVNSDQNMVLIPNIMGPVNSLTIVPTPGTSLLMLGGLAAGARRRRG